MVYDSKEAKCLQIICWLFNEILELHDFGFLDISWGLLWDCIPEICQCYTLSGWYSCP